MVFFSHINRLLDDMKECEQVDLVKYLSESIQASSYIKFINSLMDHKTYSYSLRQKVRLLTSGDV